MAPQPLPGYRYVGGMSRDAVVLGVLYVPLRNAQLIYYYAQAVSTPGSPLYHRFLTPQQVQELFYPTQRFEEAESYLASHGLRVLYTAADSIIVFEGTVKDVESALGVKVGMFSNGSLSYYAVTSYSGNALGLVPYVSNVTAVIFRSPPLIHIVKPDLRGQQVVTSLTAYSLPDVVRAYNVTPLYSMGYYGQNVSVGILDFYGDPIVAQALAYFDQVYGLPPANLTVVPIGPYDPNLGLVTGWNVEIELDVESVQSAAPRAHIVLYAANGALPLVVPIATIDQLDQVSVVSQSFGIYESEFSYYGFSFYLYNIYLTDMYYALGTAEGITFLAGSGDGGGMGYSAGPLGGVNYPASSPWVLAVGGTTTYLTFYPNGTPSSSYSTAWSAAGFVPFFFNFGGSTGGYSYFEPMPWWQEGVAPTPPQGFPYGRAIPDVSANANIFPGIYQITYGNETIIDGGTSEASPLTAGLLALIESYLNQRLGLLSPTLYALYKNPSARGAFIPVTFGYNIPWFSNSGYNLVTGLGSINVGVLAHELSNQALVSNHMPSLSVSVVVNGVSMVNQAEAYQPLELLPGESATIEANITYSNGSEVTNGDFKAELVTPEGVMLTKQMTYVQSLGLWQANITVPENCSGTTYVQVNGTSAGRWGIGFTEAFSGYFVTVAWPVSDSPWDPSLGLPLYFNVTELNGSPAPSSTEYEMVISYYNFLDNTYSAYNEYVFTGPLINTMLYFNAPAGYVAIEFTPPAFGLVPVFFGDCLQNFELFPEVLSMPGVVAPGQYIFVEGLVYPPIETESYQSLSLGTSLFNAIEVGSNVTAELVSLSGKAVSSAQITFNPNVGLYTGLLQVPENISPGYYWVVLEANYSSYTLASSNISPSYVEGIGVGMVYVGAPLNVKVWVSPGSPAQGQSITIYANITYGNGTPVKYGQFSAVLVPEADLGAFEGLALSGVNVPLYYNSSLGLWVGSATTPSPFSPGSTAFSGLYAGEPWAVVVTGNAFNGVPAAKAAIAHVAETKYVYYTGVLTPGSFYPYNGLFYDANITGFNGTIEGSVFEGNVYIVDSNVTIADSQSYGTIYVVNSNVSLVNVRASRVVVASGVANLYMSDVISSVSGHVNYVTPPQITALVSGVESSIMHNLSALWSEEGELRQEYSSLSSTVSGLSSTVSQLTSEASQLSTRISDLSGWLMSNVSAVNRTVTGLGNSLSALSSKLTSEASQLSTRISDLSGWLMSNVSAVNRTVTGLGNSLSALSSTVSGLSSTVSNISSRVSSISTTATKAYSSASRSFSLGVGVAVISVISLVIAAVALSRRH
ncbi:protease pro-enzyme activation domain-containing protein [Acidilobus sp. 7A]|uniref:protease pro-enzyme activation domain-containing protein n=1 Tax=Acidilobus sp. 7A TaxID=1577685 RepID=UPI000E3E9864|nr:protease pro-enzyme activation domain-containing protein [Acidilobus sp. 7A]